MRYASPDAFRMALEARFKQLHPNDSSGIQRLRKRVVFERFLGRLQATPDGPWFLKGAVALELRFGNRSRATRDLDLGLDLALQDDVDLSQGEVGERLRAAATCPLEDFFTFSIPADREEVLPIPHVRAYRFGVRAFLADRPFEDFSVDVGTEISLVAPAEEISESGTLVFAGLTPRRFRVISLPQHFAEKIHAFTRPWEDRENTRVKDLVDIALILEMAQPDPGVTRFTLESVFGGRESHPLPSRIPDPPDSWAATYARDSAGINLASTEIDEAMELLRNFWSNMFP